MGAGFSLQTLFQASSIFKTCSWQHSIASGTDSGSARLTSDNNAISVQLQLQLPTGTELGNKKKLEFIESRKGVDKEKEKLWELQKCGK